MLVNFANVSYIIHVFYNRIGLVTRTIFFLLVRLLDVFFFLLVWRVGIWCVVVVHNSVWSIYDVRL